MKYNNVNRLRKKEYSEDKIFDRSELLTLFKIELNRANLDYYEIVEHSKSLFSFGLKLDNDLYEILCFVKNITGAGWSNKPDMKRIQISNSFIEFDNNSVDIAFGVYNYDNNPIIVAWDLYRYAKHKTVRSCYVTTDSLIRGYEEGYYEGVVSSQKLWIFKGEYFKRFFENYICYLKDIYKKEY